MSRGLETWFLGLRAKRQAGSQGTGALPRLPRATARNKTKTTMVGVWGDILILPDPPVSPRRVRRACTHTPERGASLSYSVLEA